MDYRTDRFSSQPIYVETFNELFLFESDMFLIFDTPDTANWRWVVEDVRGDPDGEIPAFTRVICMDETSGEIIHNMVFIDENDGDASNSFYAIIIQYVAALGYDTGELLIDIQVPNQLGSYYENGALMRLSWHSFTNIELGGGYEINNSTLPPGTDEDKV